MDVPGQWYAVRFWVYWSTSVGEQKVMHMRILGWVH